MMRLAKVTGVLSARARARWHRCFGVFTVALALLAASCGDVSRPSLSGLSGEGATAFKAVSASGDEYYLRIIPDEETGQELHRVRGDFFVFDVTADSHTVCIYDECVSMDIASGPLDGEVYPDGRVSLTADAWEPDEPTFQLRGRRLGEDFVLTSSDGAFSDLRFSPVSPPTASRVTAADDDRTVSEATQTDDIRYSASITFSEPEEARGRLYCPGFPVWFLPLTYPCTYDKFTHQPRDWSYHATTAGMYSWGNGYHWIDIYDLIPSLRRPPLARLWVKANVDFSDQYGTKPAAPFVRSDSWMRRGYEENGSDRVDLVEGTIDSFR